MKYLPLTTSKKREREQIEIKFVKERSKKLKRSL